ncbi:MAG TPA: Hsp20/alpha crystallin family protein [Flavobacteriales bacterium]|nr:Hsp20/alpha crystallin family protein [Flavobacteriales bacterium]
MNMLIKNNQCVPTNRFWFDDFFTREVERLFTGNPANTSVTPAANVWEDEKQLSLELALPGIKKEDVKIKFDNGVLSITAEQVKQTETDNKNYIRKEFGKVSYSRSFKVNEKHFKTDAITASMDNGVLMVTLPKQVEEKKESQYIQVN